MTTNRREYEKARRRQIRDYIREFKARLGCCIDGCNIHDWRCLEIDHVDGKTYKATDTSNISSVAAFHREFERHSCRVICCNHHAIATQMRLESSNECKTY